MKIVTLNAKTLIIAAVAFVTVFCILMIAVSGGVFNGGETTGASGRVGGKELPIYRVKTSESDKRISITFDNAWGADDIPSILATLKKYNAKATFFVLGTWAEKFPEIVKQIYDEGHEIANHSYAHYKPTKLSEQGIKDEISKCNAAIKNVTGKECKIYRAPYGDYNDLVVKTAEQMGMYMIQWDVDSLDWKDEMSADAIYQRVIERVRPGSIVLFHNDTNHTQDILPKILEKLYSDGYQFVTISELIYKDGYIIDNNGEQQINQ